MNRESLYAEFGGKQELFELALSHHMETNFARVIGPLEAPDAGLAQIPGALEWWGGGLARGPGSGVGSLLCNTASERASADPGARKYVRNYVKRIAAGFKNALTNAHACGELCTTADIEAEACFLTSHAIGQLTQIRSTVAPRLVESAARTAIAHIGAPESDRGHDTPFYGMMH